MPEPLLSNQLTSAVDNTSSVVLTKISNAQRIYPSSAAAFALTTRIAVIPATTLEVMKISPLELTNSYTSFVKLLHASSGCTTPRSSTVAVALGLLIRNTVRQKAGQVMISKRSGRPRIRSAKVLPIPIVRRMCAFRPLRPWVRMTNQIFRARKRRPSEMDQLR